MVRYYTANKSRSQGRKFYSIIFRHPVRKDSGGKSGLRIRRGLGTSSHKRADELVAEMNDLLSSPYFWTLTAKAHAQMVFSPVIISAFYYVLENKTESFIMAYESGLGKGWDVVDAIDAKDALKKFQEREPDIYKLCQHPYGVIRVAKEENIE